MRLLLITLLSVAHLTLSAQHHMMMGGFESNINLNEDIIFLYELDTDASCSDATPNGNDGQVYDAATYISSVTGILNNAINRSTDDGASGILSDVLNYTSQDIYSYSFWYYPTNPSPVQIHYLYSVWDNYTGLSFTEYASIIEVFDNSTQHNLGVVTDNSVSLEKNNLSNNTWHHVVVTRTSTDFKLYVDGTLADSSTGTYSAVDMFLFFAGDYGGKCALGSYDQFGFWLKELNSDEVAFLYNSGSGITYTNW